MITEAYCSFETAKLLKEKGFDEPTREYCEEELWGNELTKKYTFKHLYCAEDEPFFNNIQGADEHKWSVPTQQIAMRWLREVHHIHIQTLCPVLAVELDTTGVKYNVVISDLKDCCLAFDTSIEDIEYDSYEEACEAAIKYCLENLIL